MRVLGAIYGSCLRWTARPLAGRPADLPGGRAAAGIAASLRRIHGLGGADGRGDPACDPGILK